MLAKWSYSAEHVCVNSTNTQTNKQMCNSTSICVQICKSRNLYLAKHAQSRWTVNSLSTFTWQTWLDMFSIHVQLALQVLQLSNSGIRHCLHFKVQPQYPEYLFRDTLMIIFLLDISLYAFIQFIVFDNMVQWWWCAAERYTDGIWNWPGSWPGHVPLHLRCWWPFWRQQVQTVQVGGWRACVVQYARSPKLSHFISILRHQACICPWSKTKSDKCTGHKTFQVSICFFWQTSNIISDVSMCSCECYCSCYHQITDHYTPACSRDMMLKLAVPDDAHLLLDWQQVWDLPASFTANASFTIHNYSFQAEISHPSKTSNVANT